MHIDDNIENTYKIYKTTDKLVEEFIDNYEDPELEQIYNEYNQLENENIIRNRKVNKMLTRFSEELDKINKYPFIQLDDESKYLYTQYYLMGLSIVFMFILFYFQTILVFLLFPIGLFIGDTLGIIERVNY